MNRPPSKHDQGNYDQEIDIQESQVQGHVGQAGRNLYQATLPRNVEVSRSDRPLDPKQDRKYRKVLLNKVRNQWIKRLLQSALKTQSIIDLNLEEREDILKPQPKMEQAIPGQQRQDLPAGTQIIDIFRQRGQGARMLILGQPGAGKSVALWMLARDLLDEAELNPEQPIPVYFLLSTWQENQSIADWLVPELKEKYGVSETLGRHWVENERLLLLLDGLDEVRENLQEDCVEAINDFLGKHGSIEPIWDLNKGLQVASA